MRRRRARTAGDRGAAMVEAAIVTPVFFLLVFAIIEFGMLMRDNLTLANGTRDGTRTATTMGDDIGADYNILRTIENSTKAMPTDQIDRIVIFNAGGTGGEPTTSCKNGNGSSTAGAQCNVYTASDLDRQKSDFGCKTPSTLDSFWCPSTRKIAQSVASGGPPDYIGVWIEGTHPWVTGLWGDKITITDQVVLRMEPQLL